MKIALVWAFAAAAVIATEATEVRTFGAPVVWAELDVDALKGRPAQLAWSDDDSTLYLQVVEGTRADKLTYHHYLIRKNESPAPLDRQPVWAQAYWKWKSAKSFFGDPLMTIEVDTTQQLLDDPRDRNTTYLESGRTRLRPSRPRRSAASGSPTGSCSKATSSASSSTSRCFPATRSRGRRNRCSSSRSDLRPGV